MGRPELTQMTVAVTYDRSGEPEHIEYYDQEGCGHTGKPVELSTPVSILVAYHLGHLAGSHDIHPRVMCPATITAALDHGATSTLVRNVVLHCVLDKHDDTVKHMFEVD